MNKISVGTLRAGLGHFQKCYSRTGKGEEAAVFLGFGSVSAQLQGYLNLRLRRSLAKNPKILAPCGYNFFSNALACVFAVFFGLGTVQAQTNVDKSSVTNYPPSPRRPSVVLILADNIGYGDLSCYGQTKIKTPNLDKLASEGIRFTSYYTASPDDQPSRASLLTGLEPRHVDASFSHPLPMDAVTMATVLQEFGYHTGLMGEWNLGDTPPVEPNTKGFEEFAGSLSQAHARDYFSENIYRQETETGSNRLETLSANWNNQRGLYIPDLLGVAAGNFITINQPDRLNHHQPFFLVVSYPVPHYSGVAPKDSPYASELWPQPEKDRAAMIAHMDENVGAVLAKLAKLKLDTNTVVIFTSIGGPQTESAMAATFFNSAGPLRGEAGSVHEGGIRVPMIVRWPARIKPGQVSDAPWAAWDILPTLAEIAFMKPPKGIDGLSVLPLLNGKGKREEHKSFYWGSHEGVGEQAARMENWKIVQIGTNAPALYNLKADIGEKTDVAAKNPEVLKRMKALLEPGK